MPTDSAANTPSERKKENPARRLGRLIHEFLFPGARIMRKLREAEDAPPTTTWKVSRGTREYIMEISAVSDRRPGTVYEWAGLFESGENDQPKLRYIHLVTINSRNPDPVTDRLAKDHPLDARMDPDLTLEDNLRALALRCHQATQDFEAALDVHHQEQKNGMAWAKPLAQIREQGTQSLPPGAGGRDGPQ